MADSDPQSTGTLGGYLERLGVPGWMWVVALGLWAAVALALSAALSPWVGLPLLVLGGGAVVVGLRAAGGEIEVADGVLRAGPARLPLEDAGSVRALDASAAWRLRGPEADPRAYLYLRGWVPTAIRIEVVDASDPAPYWYVSTRHPEALVAAVEAARPGSASRPA